MKTLVLALALLVGGCASRSEAPVTPAQHRASQRGQIAQLEARITREESALGIRPASRTAAPPAAGETAPEAPAQAPAATPSPPPSPPTEPPPGVAHGGDELEAPACERFCRSATSICDASRRICSIAREMGDDWAAGRCQVAGLSCTNARRETDSRCGGCGP